VPSAFCNPCICMSSVIKERVRKALAQPANARRDNVVDDPCPVADDGMADQHRIAEYFWRERIEQLFLFIPSASEISMNS